MRKENNIKFPEKIKREEVVITMFETAEEAIDEAKRQLAESNVSPASITVTYRDGYVNALGEVFGANGIAAEAPATPPKPVESTLQEPATESYELQEKEAPAEEPVAEETSPVEEPEEPEEPVAEETSVEEEPAVESEWPPTLDTKEETTEE